MQMRVALQSAGVYGAVSSETVSFEEQRDVLLAIYQGVRRMFWIARRQGRRNMAWEPIKAISIGHDRVCETK
jgi:hypothetical protein